MGTSSERGGSDQSNEVLGAIGVVTVPIGDGRPGEVVLKVRGGTEAFAAWADEPIGKHTRVVVVDCPTHRSVHVTPM
jgi:membrane protein implicated in regulation of membrane protease activity